jgi:hypothetical protein
MAITRRTVLGGFRDVNGDLPPEPDDAQPFTPPPPPTSSIEPVAPPQKFDGGAGNAYRPLELHPDAGGLPTQPLESPRTVVGTPSRPQEPTPIAGQPPQPFSPMPSPITRRGISTGGPNSQSSSLLGKAGGLLGGGLGVPGAMGGQGSNDISDLIANLFKLANR